MSDNDPVKTALRKQPKWLKELLAGGVAGGVAKTAVAPLERAKILFQTRRLQNLGVTGILSHIWQTEGVVGMFRGNAASVLRIVPYAAIHFGAYEHYRRLIVDNVLTTPTDSATTATTQAAARDGGAAAAEGGGQGGGSGGSKVVVHPGWDLLAGSAAGATAVLLTYPLDLVRTRMAWATDAPKARQGAVAASSTHPAALASTVGGVTPGVTPHHGVTPGIIPHHGVTPTATGGGMAGAVVGGTAQPRHVSHPSIRGILLQIWRDEGGVVGLYRGVNPTLLGILPYAGLKFYVYQSLKAWYKDYGIDLATPAVSAPPLPGPTTLTAMDEAKAHHIDNAAAATECVSLDSRAAGSNAQEVVVEHKETGRGGRLPLAVMLGFGGVSGLVAQTVTYPLDVIRRRMQVGGPLPSGPGIRPVTTWSTACTIISQEGLWGLMRGLSINYMKVVPSTAIGFTIYDYLKDYLDVKGNL